jgi:hypothetical protein
VDPAGGDLDVAGLAVLGVAGQGLGHHLEGDAPDHGHAVAPAALAHRMGAVAQRLELQRRHLVRGAAGLLQEQQVGARAPKEARDMRRALADRVDVEGGEANHWRRLC